MFYDIFDKRCRERGTSPFACCKAIGLNGGTAAYWKRSGGIPKRETLEKLSEYLDCTVDYLLGRELPPGIHVTRLESPEQEAETLSILSGLDDEDLMKVREYIEFLKSKKSRPD